MQTNLSLLRERVHQIFEGDKGLATKARTKLRIQFQIAEAKEQRRWRIDSKSVLHKQHLEARLRPAVWVGVLPCSCLQAKKEMRGR